MQVFDEQFDCFFMLSQCSDEQSQNEDLESRIVEMTSRPTNLTRLT